MKKLFRICTAGLLAVVLLLAGLLPALAEAPAAEAAAPAGPTAVTLRFTLDSEALLSLVPESAPAPDEETLSLLKALCSVISNITLRTVKDGTDTRTDVLLKDKPVCFFFTRQDETGIRLFSDAFPKNTVFFIPAAAMGGNAASLPAISEEDSQRLIRLFTVRLLLVRQTVNSKIGDPEEGEWTIEGTVFTSRRPVNITAREAGVLLLETVDEIVKDETVRKIASAAGLDLSGLDTGKALENLKAQPEEQFPSTAVWLYSNEAGDSLADITLESNSQTVALTAGTAGENTVLRITGPGTAMLLTADRQGRSFDLSASFTQDGMDFGFNASAVTGENGETAGTAATLVGGRNLFTVDFTVAPAEKPEDPFTAEGLTEVTTDDLKDEKTAKKLGTRLATSILLVINKAASVMPEEVNLLLTYVSTKVPQ